jgi:N-acetylmuramoyl-L-alanine amidase
MISMQFLFRVPRMLRVVIALLPLPLPASAQQNHTLPVFRQLSTSPKLLETKKTFVIDHFNGCPYVSLAQVASAVDGQVHWRSVAHTVELTLHGHKVSFLWNSWYAHLDDDARVRLEQPTVKNGEGFWVPISFFSGPEFFSATGSRVEWQGTPVHAHSTAKALPIPEPAAPAPKHVAVAVPMPAVAPAPVVTHTLRAVRRIVLDPGHGGKDPGTVGGHGVEEKALNLMFAQSLAELLRERYGYEVLLTRTDDTFIPLAQRARIANQWNADLFVSLHCNASLSSKLRGFEVYFLSEKASDAHASAVARAENASLALEDHETVPAPLKALLRSLVKNANINDSSALGSLIDHDVNNRQRTKSLGIQQAGFYVLRGAEMPAVLIESGFLSNSKEERLLQDANYRQHMMEDVGNAIDAYDKRKQRERR